MNEEEKPKTDIKGKIKYNQDRIASGRAPHNLLALEDEKFRKAISETEESA